MEEKNIKKGVKKFKSQSVNSLFKDTSLGRSEKVTSGSLESGSTHGGYGIGQSRFSILHQLGSNNGTPTNNKQPGIKTLSLASGPKLKIIPEKRFVSGSNQITSGSTGGENNPLTNRIITEDNNYWKKSRSNSPEIKKESRAKEDQVKLQGSRFTFSNLSLPPSTSGFNWADIDDEDDDSFNDKIWSSLVSNPAPFTPTESFDQLKSNYIEPYPSKPSLTEPYPPKSGLPESYQQKPGFTENYDKGLPESFTSKSQSTPQFTSPIVESSQEIFSPVAQEPRPGQQSWQSASSLVGFRRHTSSSLNFSENNSSANSSNHFFNSPNSFNRYNSTGILSTSFDKLNFQDKTPTPTFESEPVKLELFNPITGKVEVFANSNTRSSMGSNETRPPPEISHHPRSFDSSYINHNTPNKQDIWKPSTTVWNSRENSLSNDVNVFSPNLNEPVSSPVWSDSRKNSDTLQDSTLTTPNTLRGLSRFFPSPMTEQHSEYFPGIMKRHSSETFDPLSNSPQLRTLLRRLDLTETKIAPTELVTTSIPSQETNDNYDKDDEDYFQISFPSLKLKAQVSDPRDSIQEFVLGDSIRYPEGFSSTFYKRGVNNFMFVRELQSKVAINNIRNYDYAEFRINIPISQTSMAKLQAQQDPDQSNRIKRSHIINIDVRELEGKSVRRGPSHAPSRVMKKTPFPRKN